MMITPVRPITGGWTTQEDLNLENLISVIWTENYLEPDDLEIKSTYSSTEWLSRFKPGQFYYHSESNRCARIHTRSLEETASGEVIMTAKGSGAESIFQKRSVRPQPYNANAGYVGGTPWSIVTGVWNDIIDANYPYDHLSPLDGAAMSATGNTSYPPTDPDWADTVWPLPVKDAYTWARELLDPLSIGIYSDMIVALNPKAMRFRYRIPYDISASIIFNHKAGHIGNVKILHSEKNYYEQAAVSATWGSAKNVLPDNKSGWSSTWHAKELPVYVTDSAPGTSGETTKNDRYLRRQGKNALSDKVEEFILSCDVAPLNPYKYGTSYSLGDLVGVRTPYLDTPQKMRVTQYIRYYGPDGTKAYPSLSDPRSV